MSVVWLAATGRASGAFILAIGFSGTVATIVQATEMDPAVLVRGVSGFVEFSSIYTYALAFAPKTKRILALSASVAAFAVSAILFFRAHLASSKAMRDYIALVVFFILGGAVIFIVWKHSVVRADDHLLRLFFFVACISPILVQQSIKVTTPIRERRLAFGACLLAAIVAGASALRVGPQGISWGGRFLPSDFVANLRAIANTSHHRGEIEAEFRREIDRSGMAVIRQITGEAPLDHFGNNPGAALFSGARYLPRPVPIRFLAVTEGLSQRNAAFMASGRAEFVLFTGGTIDGRLESQDDPFSMVELLRNYQPVGNERTADVPLVQGEPVTLFRRRAATEAVTWRAVRTVTGRTGEFIELDGSGSAPTLACQTFRYGPIGRALTFLYRPPRVEVDVRLQSGGILTFKYIATPEPSCFLASPFFHRTGDVRRYFADDSADRVIAYRLRYPSALLRSEFGHRSLRAD